MDLVGEFAYDRATRQLIRDLGAHEREEAFFTATIVPEPDNPHSEHGRALSVRWNNQVIGYFADTDSVEYQQIRRVTASGLTATSRARLWYFVGDDRKNRVYLYLNIRLPDTLLPLNDPPTEGWTLLPHGSTVQVTKESDHLDVLLDHVPPDGTGQLLVTLHEFTAGTRTTWPGIEVRLDGERIGELTKATSAKFAAAVRHFDAIGLTTVARATIKGSSLSAEVTLQAAKAHELTDEDLEPQVSPLPRLTPFEADATRYDVPDAYIPSAGERIKAQAMQKVRETLRPRPTPTPPQSSPETPPVTPPTSPPTAPAPPPQHGDSPTRKAVTAVNEISSLRPGLISSILLWIGAVFGVLCIPTGLSLVGESVSYAFGMILFGSAIILACGWPLSRRRADKKAVADWEEEKRRNEELSSMLTPEDATVAAGLTQAPRPAPVPRHWKKVGTIAAVLGILGFILAGTGTDDLDGANDTSTVDSSHSR